MKLRLTLDIEPRVPSGWVTTADATDTLSRLVEEISGMDYDSHGVAFVVTRVTPEVVEP